MGFLFFWQTRLHSKKNTKMFSQHL